MAFASALSIVWLRLHVAAKIMDYYDGGCCCWNELTRDFLLDPWRTVWMAAPPLAVVVLWPKHAKRSTERLLFVGTCIAAGLAVTLAGVAMLGPVFSLQDTLPPVGFWDVLTRP